MKLVLWGAFVVLAALWTGGAALTAQLVQWSAQSLASGAGAGIAGAATTMAMPPWLAPWIDPAAWAAMQQSLGALLEGMAAWLPDVGNVVGWLAPLVWVAWGLGFAGLLVLALLAHWAIGRLRPGATARPAV